MVQRATEAGSASAVGTNAADAEAGEVRREPEREMRMVNQRTSYQGSSHNLGTLEFVASATRSDMLAAAAELMFSLSQSESVGVSMYNGGRHRVRVGGRERGPFDWV